MTKPLPLWRRNLEANSNINPEVESTLSAAAGIALTLYQESLMHFYYLDESGDTGGNLQDPDQPIMVLGGVSVRDEGWNRTQGLIAAKVDTYFNGSVPENFELHAKEMLSPQGDGHFEGHPFADRRNLAIAILEILAERKHAVHYIAVDKSRMASESVGLALEFNPKKPYELTFDYLVTYINWHLKEKLGKSARGMIILDQKDEFHSSIEKIMRLRRFGGTAAHRVKWVVEFSYPVDSRKNPMIQFSDLVIYCLKRFIELENGHRDNWSNDARNFYAKCFSLIKPRVARAAIVDRKGRDMDKLNDYIKAVRVEPRTQWKRHYDLS